MFQNAPLHIHNVSSRHAKHLHLLPHAAVLLSPIRSDAKGISAIYSLNTRGDKATILYQEKS